MIDCHIAIKIGLPSLASLNLKSLLWWGSYGQGALPALGQTEGNFLSGVAGLS
jgi:hypothetical protein